MYVNNESITCPQVAQGPRMRAHSTQTNAAGPPRSVGGPCCGCRCCCAGACHRLRCLRCHLRRTWGSKPATAQAPWRSAPAACAASFMGARAVLQRGAGRARTEGLTQGWSRRAANVCCIAAECPCGNRRTRQQGAGGRRGAPLTAVRPGRSPWPARQTAAAAPCGRTAGRQ